VHLEDRDLKGIPMRRSRRAREILITFATLFQLFCLNSHDDGAQRSHDRQRTHFDQLELVATFDLNLMHSREIHAERNAKSRSGLQPDRSFFENR